MQKKVTIIIGEPATGKTTLVRHLLRTQGAWMFHQPKWVPYHADVRRESVILGDYSNHAELYAGADRLSMSVQPHARKFIKDSTGRHFLMEGDRLGNMKFIGELMRDGHDVKVIRLMANEATRKSRSVIQRRNQAEKFLKSRATKLANMHAELSILPGMAYQAIPHVCVDDTRFIVANLTRSDSERRI